MENLVENYQNNPTGLNTLNNTLNENNKDKNKKKEIYSPSKISKSFLPKKSFKRVTTAITKTD